jgi:hypothetical protein
MSLSRPSSTARSEQPSNTLVVLPKTPPIHSGALWALFWSIGVVMGLLGRELVVGDERPSVSGAAAVADGGAQSGEPAEPQTPLAVEVRAVLELPTERPTTPPPTPLVVATVTPLPDAEFCAAEKPGEVCRVPFPPPPTPTPFPTCDHMAVLQPGTWCVWPTPRAGDVELYADGAAGTDIP